MPLKTKRWNDPKEPDDGHRLLITRYRPRGVSKADETWDEWEPALGPSKELLAAFKTEGASPLQWGQYRRRYLEEQKRNMPMVEALARRVTAGETITLLCSSSCVRESRCHRSLLRELIEAAMPPPAR
ncbi:MAG TPA: DUF488 family protein [Tepidisphaeraceae bacterium]|nr:DUF488 family protein [Tepidisphaeraceae bacterium]